MNTDVLKNMGIDVYIKKDGKILVVTDTLDLSRKVKIDPQSVELSGSFSFEEILGLSNLIKVVGNEHTHSS